MHILAQINEPSSQLFSLPQLFESIEMITGLEVSVYPPAAKEASPAINQLPTSYRRHMSAFCRAVKNTRDGRGCQGHDSGMTNRKAAGVGRPFVQVCHAGIAEVIVPVFADGQHLATVFIGQAVTPEIEAGGFGVIWKGVKARVVSRRDVRRGFVALPRMTEERLLRIGLLADAAIRGLIGNMSADAFALEVRLQNAPAVRRAVDILNQERCWQIAESEMAKRVHLSPAHFSRLFHRVLGRTFKEYLTNRRMVEAQNLLHQTDVPIGTIALRCGFSRQSYFTRRFREFTGMTPSAYRSNQRQRDGSGGERM